MRKELAIASILMLLHTIEEAVFYFWQSKPVGLPYLNVYVLGQIALYSFLAYTFFRSKSKVLYGVVGAILIYEVVHIVTSWNMRGYTPGLVTATIIILFAIQYWRKLITISSIKTT